MMERRREWSIWRIITQQYQMMLRMMQKRMLQWVIKCKREPFLMRKIISWPELKSKIKERSLRINIILMSLESVQMVWLFHLKSWMMWQISRVLILLISKPNVVRFWKTYMITVLKTISISAISKTTCLKMKCNKI